LAVENQPAPSVSGAATWHASPHPITDQQSVKIDPGERQKEKDPYIAERKYF